MNVLKICVIGDPYVGKSALLASYIDRILMKNYVSTIGVDFKIKKEIYNSQSYMFQIWDISGQERYKDISKVYYRDCYGIILVYDVTNYMSFLNIDKWYHLIKGVIPECKIILLANKTDLESKRIVSREEAEKYAKNRNMLYRETNYLDSQIKNIFISYLEDYTYVEPEITIHTPLLTSNSNKLCSCNII